MSGSESLLVIIPSTRNPKVIKDYVENATFHHFDHHSLEFLILTEDFVDTATYSKFLRDLGMEGQVMNETGRGRFLREMDLHGFEDVFPKKSHAETSFGLFYMYVNGHKYGVFVDDDTRPQRDCDYFGSHVKNLSYEGEIECLSSDKSWVNVLWESFPKHKLYPRGYPYGAMNEHLVRRTIKVTEVVASQGLWTNVPDLDAVRILFDGDLRGQGSARLSGEDYSRNFVVAKGNYLTVCSMNLAFKREIIPSFYQFKMDDNPWKIGRFDDIWSGVVLKKIIDSNDKHIVSGRPLCEHNKSARSTFKDLRVEAPGLEANERFYEVVESVDLSDGDIFEKTRKIATHLLADQDDFVSYNGLYLLRWLELLSRI